MNPNQDPQQPQSPVSTETATPSASQANTPQQPAPAQPAKKSHKKLGLFLLLGPTALLLLNVILYAITNFAFNASQPEPVEGELFGELSPVQSAINIILFITGSLGVLAWLPGIIIGAILVSKKDHAQN